MAIDKWPSNAELIADCFELGYLSDEWLTLDCTFGEGVFHKVRSPKRLIATDKDPYKSLFGSSVDFRYLPFKDRAFDCVIYDGPYKLQGTSNETNMDERYGTKETVRWQDRMQLLHDGFEECARVLGNGFLLAKCQAQVCSGAVRWQDVEYINHGYELGLDLVDRFDILSYRAQPDGRSQVHARRNHSTLLIFKRKKKNAR